MTNAQKRAVLLRSADDGGRLGNLLNEKGFLVMYYPTISITPKPFSTEEAMRLFGSSQGVIFTSSSAPRYFLESLRLSGFHETLDSSKKCYAVGKRTANIAKENGFTAVSIPEIWSSKGLLGILPESEVKQKNFLFICGDQASDALQQHITRLGGYCARLEVYENNPVEVSAERLAQLESFFTEDSPYTFIVCFSPSGVRSFFKHKPKLPKRLIWASIGETTKTQLIRSFQMMSSENEMNYDPSEWRIICPPVGNNQYALFDAIIDAAR